MFKRLRRFLYPLTVLLLLPGAVLAHGGVVEEDDMCVIRVGFYQAHFKIFLPESHSHEEFCEDLPTKGEAIFVMEYMHDGLGIIPIEFRIIRNVTGVGQFARRSHIARIEDLEAVTVFHQSVSVSPGVFAALYNFEEEGEFVGIVTAISADTGTRHTAVFPFEVGYTGLGWWPWFIALVVFLQLAYWLMSGRFSAWRNRHANAATGDSVHAQPR